MENETIDNETTDLVDPQIPENLDDFEALKGFLLGHDVEMVELQSGAVVRMGMDPIDANQPTVELGILDDLQIPENLDDLEALEGFLPGHDVEMVELQSGDLVGMGMDPIDANQPTVKLEIRESSFNRRLRSFAIVNLKHIDIREFLNTLRTRPKT